MKGISESTCGMMAKCKLSLRVILTDDRSISNRALRIAAFIMKKNYNFDAIFYIIFTNLSYICTLY